MDEKTTGARGTVLGCLAAAGAFLVLDLLLRLISLGQSGFYLEFFVFPAVLGFGVGWLMGPRWQRPILASLLLGATLVLADTIPYTIDTITMVSDENIARAIREAPRETFAVIRRLAVNGRIVSFSIREFPRHTVADESPSEIRRLAVNGRILSFLMFSPIIIGGLTALGALLGRSLQTRSCGAGRRASA